jgi:thiol:disulfide interchange protein DsbD
MRRAATWFLVLLLLAGARLQAAFDPVKDVAVAYQGGAVVLTVPAGAHLKAAFLQVALAAGTPGQLRVGPPPPTDGKDELGDGIWHGRVAVPVTGTDLPDRVTLAVTYQPCTEGTGGVCYPPTVRDLEVSGAALSGQGPAQGSSPGAGLLWVFLGLFGAGLVASLTPCVYPMIPITMAIIGAKGGGPLRGLVRSGALVLGMALTYSILGAAAARAGAALGAVAQSPFFLVPVSALFVLFGVSLLGGFEIRLPSGLQARLQGDRPRQGLGGALAMGMVLGPLSAPCVGPWVGTVLLAIAKSGRVALGAAELFVFALGMGVLFLAVGAFSASLPRSGPWLVRLKQAMGLVALGFAVWNVRYLGPSWLPLALWSAWLLLAAPVLGVFRPAEGLPSGFARGLGFLTLALGLLLGLRAAEGGLGLELLPRLAPAGAAGLTAQTAPTAQTDHSGWLEQDLDGALARARSDGRPVLVDVYARWCAECKELDRNTWPDPQVAAWLRDQAVPVRIDTFAVRKDLADRLGILGYPTVILLDPQGRELRRTLGYLPPADMLKFLRG